LFTGSEETQRITSALRSVDEAIQTLASITAYQLGIVPELKKRLYDVDDIRWILVEGAPSRVSSIFLDALMLWLVIVFLIFGIVAPRNSLI
jgi:hypothetical protein